MTKANDILTSMEAQQDEFDAVIEGNVKIPAKVVGPAAVAAGGGALYGLHKFSTRNKDKAGAAAEKAKEIVGKTRAGGLAQELKRRSKEALSYE